MYDMKYLYTLLVPRLRILGYPKLFFLDCNPLKLVIHTYPGRFNYGLCDIIW